MHSAIILIGPVNAGKSTLATLLAQRLGLQRCSLDEIGWQFYQEQGYDETMAQRIKEQNDLPAFHRYLERFHAYAVERVLADHPQDVIDFGAGHSVYEDFEQFERVQQALAPYTNVVLLLPSPDPAESTQILSRRKSNPNPSPVVFAMNEFFFGHSSSFDLAKIIVYTKDKTPEETCNEVLRRLTL